LLLQYSICVGLYLNYTDKGKGAWTLQLYEQNLFCLRAELKIVLVRDCGAFHFRFAQGDKVVLNALKRIHILVGPSLAHQQIDSSWLVRSWWVLAAYVIGGSTCRWSVRLRTLAHPPIIYYPARCICWSFRLWGKYLSACDAIHHRNFLQVTTLTWLFMMIRATKHDCNS
jgi:hypothetical protein